MLADYTGVAGAVSVGGPNSCLTNGRIKRNTDENAAVRPDDVVEDRQQLEMLEVVFGAHPHTPACSTALTGL
jgi:hypothetical protein